MAVYRSDQFTNSPALFVRSCLYTGLLYSLSKAFKGLLWLLSPHTNTQNSSPKQTGLSKQMPHKCADYLRIIRTPKKQHFPTTKTVRVDRWERKPQKNAQFTAKQVINSTVSLDTIVKDPNTVIIPSGLYSGRIKRSQRHTRCQNWGI